MEMYKPGYLGKVIPVYDTNKLTDFVTDKYDAFSKIYNLCRTQSANITDIKVVETCSPDTLSVKVSCDIGVVENIKKAAEGDNSISIDNNVITAKSS